MHRIFEQAKVLNAKYAPLHLSQMLTRLTEKVERANSIRNSGGTVSAEDWSELQSLTTDARRVLERAGVKGDQ